ncbi:hypothetical protein E3P84_02428 [Wallemia ichthyophaga]|nr:hypothetical protein E3P84_02428 [Wallemia ichthyophaga]TIB41086.1 hypothetical protein E3P83_02381 [Wallemia ichthyophaga]
MSNYSNDTTDEGGYGVNTHGDSFSRSNQAGFEGVDDGSIKKTPTPSTHSDSSFGVAGLANDGSNNETTQVESFAGSINPLQTEPATESNSNNVGG